jgi:hypothetical protein
MTMTRAGIKTGLDDGALELGGTRPLARGTGMAPSQGQLPLAEQVNSIEPPFVATTSLSGSSSAR